MEGTIVEFNKNTKKKIHEIGKVKKSDDLCENCSLAIDLVYARLNVRAPFLNLTVARL